MSKLFTAIAIMQLRKQGLDLDSPIQDYLQPGDWELSGSDMIYIKDMQGWMKNGKTENMEAFKNNQKITLRHLLTHTAGLMGGVVGHPLSYNSSLVGERNYSNYGYQLLARIVKNYSQSDSFVSYIRKNIFLKAGMENADRYAEIPPKTEPQPFNVSLGKMNTLDPEKETHMTIPKPDGNGCWWMTAEDMTLFAQAFLHGKLLDKPIMQEMLTPQIEREGGGYQGLGFFIENVQPLVYAHPGSVAGRSAAVLIAEGKEPLIVVCLSNTNEGVNVVGDVIRLLKGEEVQGPWKSESIETNHSLYMQLKEVEPIDIDKIKKIIQDNKAQVYVLEMIADQLNREGKEMLATTLRELNL